MKLYIELVPSTSWYNNLRKVLSKEEWDKVRKKAYKDAGYKCAICGTKGRLNCHEIWEYNDVMHVQTLRGFIALCDLCHHVKHIGFAQILAREGKLNLNDVINHFMIVNACTKDEFYKHLYGAIDQWKERSKHHWAINLNGYHKARK